MARQPKAPTRPPSRRGKRDYAAEYAYRVRNVPKGQRAEARGHGSNRRAFMRFIRDGDHISCDVSHPKLVRKRRTVAGRRVLVEVYDEIPKDVRASGRREDRFFMLRNLTRAELIDLIEFEVRVGVTFSLAPSEDQRRLVSDDETAGGY